MLKASQLETYHGPGDRRLHGDSGPVHISDGTFRSKVSEEDFIKAAAQVGWSEIQDLQDLDANNGVERWLRSVSKDGKRQDTARVYLHDKLNGDAYPNLHVLVQSKVIRVLLDDDKRAIGVEYTPNPDFLTELATTQSPKRQVRARKLVVVSCGACGTPLVLERSGLGDPEILTKAGVPVQVELPGVGRDYQDHQLLLYPYASSLQPHETIDSVLRNPGDRQSLIDKRDERLGWNTVDVCSKVRPSYGDVISLGPQFQAAWDKDFANVPDRPLVLIGLIGWYVKLTVSPR